MNPITRRKSQRVIPATKSPLQKLSRSRSRMRYQGYIYRFSANRNNAAFWHCVRCQATLKFDCTGKKVIQQSTKHKHAKVNYSQPDGRYELPDSGYESDNSHTAEQESADMETPSLLNDSNASTAKLTLSHCNQVSLSILTAQEGTVCRESSTISIDSDSGLMDSEENLENIRPTRYAAGCVVSSLNKLENLENCASESVAEDLPQTENGANSENTSHSEALNEQTFSSDQTDPSQLQESSQTDDQEQAQQLNEHSIDECDLQIVDVKWNYPELTMSTNFQRFKGMLAASNMGRMVDSISNVPGLDRTREKLPVGHPALVVELPDGSRLNFMGSFMCVECRKGIMPCTSCTTNTKCRICCEH
ncbi:hypothetical protein Ddc_09321 [Ditylenchus destructor]|nr:hypothetical protein Ddc_09321 [Ditylenchus destructor]